MRKSITTFVLLLLMLSPSILKSQSSRVDTFCYPVFEIRDSLFENSLNSLVAEWSSCRDKDTLFPKYGLNIGFRIEGSRSLELGDTILVLTFEPFFTWEDVGPRYLGIVQVDEGYIYINNWPPVRLFKSTNRCRMIATEVLPSQLGEQITLGGDTFHKDKRPPSWIYQDLACGYRIFRGELERPSYECKCADRQ